MGDLLNPVKGWAEMAQNKQKTNQAEALQKQQLDLYQKMLAEAQKQRGENQSEWQNTEDSIFGPQNPDAPGSSAYRGDGVGGYVPPPGAPAGDYSGIDNPSVPDASGSNVNLGQPYAPTNFTYNGGNVRTGGWTGNYGPGGPNNPTAAAARAAGTTQYGPAGSNGLPSTAGTLPGMYDWANQSDQDTIAKLNQQLGQIGPVAGPEYAGDVSAQAKGEYAASPEAQARQQQALDLLKGQTGVQETGEEKALRYNARQKQEQQQRSDLGALRNDLRGRGMLGSGAEIAGALGSQQNTGMQRTASELGAQANAMQRAMQALQAYNTGSATARGQSAQEQQAHASAADVAARANQTSKDQMNIARNQSDQQNASRQERVAGAEADAATNAAESARRGAQNVANTKLQVASGKTGSALSGLAAQSGASSNLAGALGDKGNFILNKPNIELPGLM